MTLEARKSIIKFDSVYSELFAKKLVLETHTSQAKMVILSLHFLPTIAKY